MHGNPYLLAQTLCIVQHTTSTADTTLQEQNRETMRTAIASDLSLAQHLTHHCGTLRYSRIRLNL
jgi:hypothetical protein